MRMGICSAAAGIVILFSCSKPRPEPTIDDTRMVFHKMEDKLVQARTVLVEYSTSYEYNGKQYSHKGTIHFGPDNKTRSEYRDDQAYGEQNFMKAVCDGSTLKYVGEYADNSVNQEREVHKDWRESLVRSFASAGVGGVMTGLWSPGNTSFVRPVQFKAGKWERIRDREALVASYSCDSNVEGWKGANVTLWIDYEALLPMKMTVVYDENGRSREITEEYRKVLLGQEFDPALFVIAGAPAKADVDSGKSASKALKSLATAEIDFRSNDRDENRINDFWTGDVAGLHRFGLIPRELAEADAAPLKPLVPKPVPYHGYLFRVLRSDQSENPPAQYAQATDDTSGKVHHHSSFGFVAYPAEYGKTGKYTFLINESATVIRTDSKGAAILDWPSNDQPRPAEPPQPSILEKVISDADKELRETIVTPHLREKHGRNRNLLWCATAQIAWNELMDLVGGPVRFKGKIEMAGPLNLKEVTKDDLDETWYIARAGVVGKGIVEGIKGEFQRKFPDRPIPMESMLVDPANAIVTYAYLLRDLPFKFPLTRSSMDFMGKRVIAFGRKGADGQIVVWRFAGPADFVVELKTRSEQDRLIVARIQPGILLRDTIQSAIKHASGKSEKSFGEEDEFLMPCFNFEVTRHFKELIGQVPQDSLVGLPINHAAQMIKFRLDEKGARLESAALFSRLNGDESRRMICKGPFLVLLMKQGAKNPYFALWVETPELMAEAEN